MEKIKCKKCGGYYFDNSSLNSLIADRINNILSYLKFTDEDWEIMNPDLRANTKGLIHDAKKGIKQHLGEDNFCECMFKKCMAEKHIFDPFKNREGMSKSELEQIKQKGERMMLINAIENIFKKYNF